MAEPPLKKLKTESAMEHIENIIKKLTESKNNLQAVLSQDLYKDIPTTQMYVGTIKDPKDLSKAILILNQKLPLKTLQHLKRVRKKEVLLCQVTEYNIVTIQEFLNNFVPELSLCFDYFKEIHVPAVPPKLKRQSIEANKLWSCNFHPNTYLEQLASNKFFNETELKTHRNCMRVALETAMWYLSKEKENAIDNQNFNASVVFDPSIQSVVAVSCDNRVHHPIQHSAMIAIDNVAKTQHGGAWNANTIENARFGGIDVDLLTFLKEKFKDVNFGAKVFRPKSETEEDGSYGPYLCTGYYIYSIREPCLMCAMALVHARVNRVFFCLENVESGALKSRTELQSVPFLNHHFEVFTGFL